MKSKIRFFTFILLFFISSRIYAQPKAANCNELIALYAGYYDIKYYNEAYPLWQAALSQCPSASKNLYIQGEKILNYKIDNTDNKSVYIDSLLLLYDMRILYFGQKSFVSEKKGISLLQLRPDSFEQAYNCFWLTIDEQKEKVDATIIYNQIKLSHKMLLANKHDSTTYTNDYLRLYHLWQTKRKQTTNDKELKKLIGIEKSILKIELLPAIVDSLNRINPTANTKRYAANVAAAKGNVDVASNCYKEAIALAETNNDKANYYYEYAVFLYNNKQYKEASEAAKKTTVYATNHGKAYILIGNTYVAASPTLDKDDFDKRTVYWVATDNYRKAMEVDSSVKKMAKDLIATYTKYFPTKDEAFFRNVMEGTIYHVGGWINEKTEARFLMQK